MLSIRTHVEALRRALYTEAAHAKIGDHIDRGFESCYDPRRVFCIQYATLSGLRYSIARPY